MLFNNLFKPSSSLSDTCRHFDEGNPSELPSPKEHRHSVAIASGSVSELLLHYIGDGDCLLVLLTLDLEGHFA